MTWPTLQEELDRKSMLTVETLLHWHDIGKINAGQLSTGLDALFMAVSGITDEEITRIISTASEELHLGSPVMRYAYVLGVIVVGLAWTVGADFFAVKMYKNGVLKTEVDKGYGTPKEALGHMSLFRAKLLKEGYTAI